MGTQAGSGLRLTTQLTLVPPSHLHSSNPPAGGCDTSERWQQIGQWQESQSGCLLWVQASSQLCARKASGWIVGDVKVGLGTLGFLLHILGWWMRVVRICVSMSFQVMLMLLASAYSGKTSALVFGG